jgi:class 3 adenylate cyclase
MTAAAPSGVVTFLFTDVEGSTRRWEADADAMRAALTAHDAVLRSAIEAHEGFLLSSPGRIACAFHPNERRCGPTMRGPIYPRADHVMRGWSRERRARAVRAQRGCPAGVP